MVLGVEGVIEGESFETYTSPPAIDKEKDQIKINFEGENEFITMKQNSDDTFYIKVNKDLVPKKTAEYPLKIAVEDDRGAK